MWILTAVYALEQLREGRSVWGEVLLVAVGGIAIVEYTRRS
jgi:hypothetical protein